jgi:hypothetical protein
MDVSTRLTTFTRLGFAARGLLYIVIAYLVIQSGRTEDPSGALTYLAKGGGRALLIIMTLGFLAYGVWRLADAAFDIEGHGSGKKGLGGRIGALGSGVAHMLLAWQAIRLIQGSGGSGGGNRAQEGAQTALGLPGGQTMLLIAGLVLVGVGVFQLVKAAKSTFCDKLDRRVANEEWVKWTGRGGYSARGLVFIITGYFLVKAGLAEQASKAGGMPEALAWLTSPWDVLVALGLALFGCFSLIEARYRIIQDVPVEGLANRARANLPRGAR